MQRKPRLDATHRGLGNVSEMFELWGGEMTTAAELIAQLKELPPETVIWVHAEGDSYDKIIVDTDGEIFAIKDYS